MLSHWRTATWQKAWYIFELLVHIIDHSLRSAQLSGLPHLYLLHYFPTLCRPIQRGPLLSLQRHSHTGGGSLLQPQHHPISISGRSLPVRSLPPLTLLRRTAVPLSSHPPTQSRRLHRNSVSHIVDGEAVQAELGHAQQQRRQSTLLPVSQSMVYDNAVEHFGEKAPWRPVHFLGRLKHVCLRGDAILSDQLSDIMIQ